MYRVDNIYDYIQELMRRKTSPNCVFGFKVLYLDQFEDYLSKIDLFSIFPNMRVIYSTRNNRLEQAISLSKAFQTGQWESYTRKRKEPAFDYDHIKSCLSQIERHEMGWHTYFKKNNITPLQITYENIVTNFENVIIDVMNYIDIEIPEDFQVPAPTMRKLANQQSIEWGHKYRVISAVEEVEELIALNDFTSAKDIINELIQKYPNFPPLLLVNGIIMYRFGAIKRARKEFLKVTNLTPSNANAHYYLALTQNQLGETECAKESVYQSIKLDPSNTEAQSFYNKLLNKDNTQ